MSGVCIGCVHACLHAHVHLHLHASNSVEVGECSFRMCRSMQELVKWKWMQIGGQK